MLPTTIRNGRIIEGIGDDAAILAPVANPLVWTIDSVVEGVHFKREWLSFEDLGFRATMAAASDLAAMGAEPIALLAALVLPDYVSDENLKMLAEGQRAAADRVGAPLVGGNLARGGEISITTTALGSAARPLRRSGAKPGDALFMAGPVGLAAAGVKLLQTGSSLEDARAIPAIFAWRRPIARIAEGRRAAPIATAAIDVSDGLARDVGHIARESGVGITLFKSALVSPELAGVASLLGISPIELALHGGEDYALVIAAPEDAALSPEFVLIGRCEAGSPGIVLAGEDGSLLPVEERGFDHFTKPSA
ncbi:MAG: thiamine-phosphate kinase [Polyangiaceae bacterium]|nr:thiamine-phosphate kinase [Polyangiaceae bacterium]